MTPTVTVTTPPHTVRPIQPDGTCGGPAAAVLLAVLIVVLIVTSVWAGRQTQKNPYRAGQE